MQTTVPAVRGTFQEQVLDQIGLNICSGRYAPGQTLPSEPELGERFGFSRIVIREAMKSLAAKGLITVRRKVGTIVLPPECWNPFDPQILHWRSQTHSSRMVLSRDLMELRSIVEPPAARLAAERAGNEDKKTLRVAFTAMARAVEGEGDYISADLAFHTAVLNACGNPFVRQMQQSLSEILRTSFLISTRKPGGIAVSLPLHEYLCQAIERNDGPAAEEAARILIAQAESDLKACPPDNHPLPEERSSSP